MTYFRRESYKRASWGPLLPETQGRRKGARAGRVCSESSQSSGPSWTSKGVRFQRTVALSLHDAIWHSDLRCFVSGSLQD